MKTALVVPPSRKLDRWAPIASSFRDTIVVRSTAPRDRLLRAFEEVTLAEIPLAKLIGRIRNFPEKFRGAGMRADRPFLEELLTYGGNIVLERSDDELVVGLVGKLHQIRQQQPAAVRTPADFGDFHAPGYEKLVLSFRLVRVVAGTLLVLEHRTLPLDETARVRFGRYWRAIRPLAASVTRQLLSAVSERAARPRASSLYRLRTRSAHH